jgi:hypothetical protein
VLETQLMGFQRRSVALKSDSRTATVCEFLCACLTFASKLLMFVDKQSYNINIMPAHKLNQDLSFAASAQ